MLEGKNVIYFLMHQVEHFKFWFLNKSCCIIFIFKIYFYPTEILHPTTGMHRDSRVSMDYYCTVGIWIPDTKKSGFRASGVRMVTVPGIIGEVEFCLLHVEADARSFGHHLGINCLSGLDTKYLEKA